MSASVAYEAIIIDVGVTIKFDSRRWLNDIGLDAALVALRASVIILTMPTIRTTKIYSYRAAGAIPSWHGSVAMSLPNVVDEIPSVSNFLCVCFLIRGMPDLKLSTWREVLTVPTGARWFYACMSRESSL